MLYCNVLFYVMQSKLLGFPKECECMFGYWKNWLLLPVYSEGQQIKTNQTNILIRSLQLNKHKGDSSSKDVKGLTATEGSRKRYCFYLTGTGCFTCFEKICLFVTYKHYTIMLQPYICVSMQKGFHASVPSCPCCL